MILSYLPLLALLVCSFDTCVIEIQVSKSPASYTRDKSSVKNELFVKSIRKVIYQLLRFVWYPEYGVLFNFQVSA